MRTIILLFGLTSFISVSAQTHFPVSGINYGQQGAFNQVNLLSDSSHLQKKWFVSTYAGIGAGVGFFNGGNNFFLPAQIGLQLNRRLNNNLYAFVGANVSAVPSYFNFNRSFNNADLNKNYMGYPGFDMNRLGIYPGIQAGLMYVNDEKTFSISGSIGISRSSYPFYPGIRNTQNQSAFTTIKQ